MLDIAPAETEKLQARIIVIGVGGAGCNAINNMIEKKLPGVQFVSMNTDTQSLRRSAAPTKIQLGEEATQGLGAGSNPDVGRASAMESESKIVSTIKGANMVFITAGMGGGTGTGAASVIARLSREAGILTVGVVTKPFRFERKRRAELADSGIRELQQFVDTLIVIPNENLFRLSDAPTTLTDAFRHADDVLLSGVRGVTDLIVQEGRINLDFNDIKTVMKEMGKAVMGTGEASGEDRAKQAAVQAINNPLLEDISLHGASSVLINITSAEDITLAETNEAVNAVTEEIADDALVIFGVTISEEVGEKIRVSVIATGVDQEETPAFPPYKDTTKKPQPTAGQVNHSAPPSAPEAQKFQSASPVINQASAPIQQAEVAQQQFVAPSISDEEALAQPEGLFANNSREMEQPAMNIAPERRGVSEDDFIPLPNSASDNVESRTPPNIDEANDKGSPLSALRNRARKFSESYQETDDENSASPIPKFLRGPK